MPAPLCDFLMWLALSGCFRARWSTHIHDERKRNLLRNRADLSATQLDRTANLMDRALPDALVTGYEALIEGLTRPDPGDRHVLAVAIRCNASVIVTFDQKDFPEAVLSTYGVEARHPDVFVDNLLDLEPAAVVAAARRQRETLEHPPMMVDRYLEILQRLGMVQTPARARNECDREVTVQGVLFPVPWPDVRCHCTSFDDYRPASKYRPGVVPNARRNMSMNALTLS